MDMVYIFIEMAIDMWVSGLMISKMVAAKSFGRMAQNLLGPSKTQRSMATAIINGPINRNTLGIGMRIRSLARGFTLGKTGARTTENG